MLKICLAIIAIAFAATVVHAADPITPQLDKRNAVSFSAASGSDDISARRTFGGGMYAVIGSIGYSSAHTTSDNAAYPYEASFRELVLGLAVRRNFVPSEQIRPFAQLQMYRVSGSPGYVAVGGGSVSASPYLSYAALGGVEYFVSRRVSLEGMAGLGYANNNQHYDDGSGVTTHVHTRSFHTFRSAVGINFYF